MNYSENYINALGKSTGFINANIEKVIRLLDILSFISNESDPPYYKLVLKGGTAINLVFTDLARLSVDIDLDYVGNLDKVKMLEDREKIMTSLDEFALKEGFSISEKTRGSFILESRTYSYTNAYGNTDNIKVEINFIDRIHIFPTVLKTIRCFDKELMVRTPSEEELFAMKIGALIDRHKPRDLFDTYNLKNILSNVDKEKLRKLVTFYLSLDGVFEIDGATFNNISFVSDSIKKELFPVLKKSERFVLEEVKEDVISFLKDLLVLNENEKRYLKEFACGNFEPNLLFDGDAAERCAKHPMAKWRIAKIKK